MAGCFAQKVPVFQRFSEMPCCLKYKSYPEGIVASFINLTPAKSLPYFACHQAILVLCHEKRSLVKAGSRPSVPMPGQASMAHLVSPDGKQLAVLVKDSGANSSTVLQRSRPNGSHIGSSPDGAEGLPPSCCLSNVCRRPPPRSRLPVRVAYPEPHHVKAAQVEEGCGRGALAWPWQVWHTCKAAREAASTR